MTAPNRYRAAARRGDPVDIHLRDIDNDLDDRESDISELKKMIASQSTRITIGIVTLATAAILLAFDIIIRIAAPSPPVAP